MALLLHFLLFTFFTTILAAPLRLDERLLALNLTLPSQDPFYQPPAGYENAAPGSILASRQIAVPTVIQTLALGNVKSAWQLLYRSTDDSGNAIAVMTTLFVPLTADSNKFFTQSIAYDASSVDCSPSYTLQGLTTTNPDVAAIALGLNDGWYVQSPDFEGFAASFTNGIISGQAMLDSLRAGLKSTDFTGLQPTARIALNGGSGGALGIEWGLELQPTYAPELVIAGATLGSLTPNIGHVMETVDGGSFAGLIPTSITGLAKLSSTMSDYLNDNLLSDKAADFHSASTRCINDNQLYYAAHNMSTYFTHSDWIYDDVPQNMINSIGIMGLHGIPQVPLYIYKGAQDELSSVLDTDDLVSKYCSSGAPSIVYVRNILTGHEAESFLGFIGAYGYLQERLNGVPASTGCTIINSTKSQFDNSDVAALGTLGQRVVNILTNALPSAINT